MKFDNRIARLMQAMREIQVSGSESKERLMLQLIKTAERNAGDVLYNAWCAGQSPITIAAMSFHELETSKHSPVLWVTAKELSQREGGPIKLFNHALAALHAT